MGTHPIFESDFDCLTEKKMKKRTRKNSEGVTVWIKSGNPVGRPKDPNAEPRTPYVPTGRPRGRPKSTVPKQSTNKVAKAPGKRGRPAKNAKKAGRPAKNAQKETAEEDVE